jgi:hypothetical protein
VRLHDLLLGKIPSGEREGVEDPLAPALDGGATTLR